MSFVVTEETLEQEVANILSSFMGCDAITQGSLRGGKRRQFDIFLTLNGYRVVLELEIGGWSKLLEAIVQAEEYRQRVSADGIIAMVYPEEARKLVTQASHVRELALTLKPNVLVLSPFLKDVLPEITLAKLCQKVKDSLRVPVPAASVHMVVQTLRDAVQAISLELKGTVNALLPRTVRSVSLFRALKSETEEEQADEAVISQDVADIAAYVLINQLLLYQLLSKYLSPELGPLTPVTAPGHVNKFFERVLNINYEAVYKLDIASTVPLSCIRDINLVISALQAIQPESLRHDLLGRIFHEFLPPHTRKRLGAFYTRPEAAEILAALSVQRPDEKVFDPACGSGTLLVAAYRHKNRLGWLRSHRQMVEQEITGVDIMPFAAHLAAVNLTLQAPDQITNKLRVGVGNSLDLVPGEAVDTVSRWFQEFARGVRTVDIQQSESRGEQFKVETPTLIIMNPPFTKKERLSPEMKGFWTNTLGDQNYWAYFVALADALLPEGGRIAAVLPRDFFRGEYSRAVRQLLFEQGRYSLQYIVKTTKEIAFSERAHFRDFLIVLQKQLSGEPCALIHLKRSLDDLSIEEAGRVAETARNVPAGEIYEDETISVAWREQPEIRSNWRDLGYVAVFSTNSGERLIDFYKEALSRGAKKLTTVKKLTQRFRINVKRGYTPSGGELNAIFIVRPTNKARIERSRLLFDRETDDKIYGLVKELGSPFEVPKLVTRRGLKTYTYLDRLDIRDISDFVILGDFPQFEEIREKVGVGPFHMESVKRRCEERLTHLVLCRRFDFSAAGTQALAFCSEEEFVPGEAFWSIPVNLESSQALCVWFNSIFAVVEFFLGQRETRGTWLDITSPNVLELHVPELSTPSDLRPFQDAFGQVRSAELPSLMRQFESAPPGRLAVDRAVLGFLGFTSEEVDEMLPGLYEAIALELRTLHDAMRKQRRAGTAQPQQLHLTPSPN